jgi:hypothetical protein
MTPKWFTAMPFVKNVHSKQLAGEILLVFAVLHQMRVYECAVVRRIKNM